MSVSVKNNQVQLKALYEVLSQLRSAEECQQFLADLCTPAELDAMADRWQVARLVDQGLTYREIHDQTGVSTATITRTARALLHGANGYRHVLDRRNKGSRR